MNLKRIFGNTKTELRSRNDALTGKVDQLQNLNINLVKRYEKMIRAIHLEYAGKLNDYERILQELHQEYDQKSNNAESQYKTQITQLNVRINSLTLQLERVKKEKETLNNELKKVRNEITSLKNKVILTLSGRITR
jgi:chromosome segregation ATPase